MLKSSFGIYIHIPYCIQRCLYCDFATYEQSQIFPPQEYIQLLLEEMRQKSKYFTPQDVDTVYFGGGTPSLVPPELLGMVLAQMKELGFKPKKAAEITIEINPATISSEKMKQYRDIGINRYSVGAQTFNDRLLKKLGREHNAQQTRETLALLREQTSNYNFDILFALPNQSLQDLQADLDEAILQGAQHISPYCLTIPKGHQLSAGRAPDEEQLEMFDAIRDALVRKGFERYEISNFALPGFESKHNLLYWTDQEYWSLGLSAHSYSKKSNWGTRFWNVNAIGDYKKQVLAHQGSIFDGIEGSLPENQLETLEMHQSLTDFAHTSLRLSRGLSEQGFLQKFPGIFWNQVLPRLEKLEKRQLLSNDNKTWRLTEKGLVISNMVFEEMTFLKGDLKP
jgi:oxygen-independent coproporphyrinogen-3 oxidase